MLLAPLRLVDDAHTVQHKLAATATFLDTWLMRRVINYTRVGYSSAAHAMFLLVKAIRGQPLSQLISILRDRLDKDGPTLTGDLKTGREGVHGLCLNQFSRRYIFHLLARLTAFTEVQSKQPDRFPHCASRRRENTYDIEHLWPGRCPPDRAGFSSEEEYATARRHVAALLLLPADVNRSLKDKPYAEKVAHRAHENLYAASLSAEWNSHHPGFATLRQRSGFRFAPYATFGPAELRQRQALVQQLVEQIWSPDRVGGAAPAPSG